MMAPLVQSPKFAMADYIRRFVPEAYLEVEATFSPRDGASYRGTYRFEVRAILTAHVGPDELGFGAEPA